MPASTAPEALSAWQMLTQLLPVLIGGLIGIVGGLSGTAFSRFLQSKEDRKALHRTKLETVLSYLAEIENWAKRVRHHYLLDLGEESYDPSPTSRIVALTAIHFPTLYDRAHKLDIAADKYELALINLKKDMVTAGGRAMDETAKVLTAANPADTTIPARMKLAAKQAQMAVGSDISSLEAPFQELLQLSRQLLTDARTLAATLYPSSVSEQLRIRL